MDEFEGFLEQAAAQIAPEYFLLPIHNADPRHRERVYCYELYHQLRKQWQPDCPWRLNGEVDKGGHPYFPGTRRAPKPDFLVHIPGTGNNYAVIEVKSPAVDGRHIRIDIRKLVRFRGLGYQRALYLLYGMTAAEALHRIQQAGLTVEHFEAVEIWVHPSQGEPAARAH
jgi:hypothetical protein